MGLHAGIEGDHKEIGIDGADPGGSLHSVNLVLGYLHHDRQSLPAYDSCFRLQTPHLILNSQGLK